MMKSNRFKRKSFVLLSTLAMLFLFGCQATKVASVNGAFLLQDLSGLENTNGKIVKLQAVYPEGEWASKSKSYKIRYLSDGLEVVGYLVRPKKEKGRFPVIIYNRGGNREFSKLTTKSLKYLSFLSAKGYVVLASQYRGNDGGDGEEEFGGKDINDVLNLIKLAMSLPFVDSGKIGMLGYSRGGMMTYLAIKNRAPIKAAVVVGGLTDLEQTYNEREDAMKRVIRDLVGMDRKEWEKRSACYWPQEFNVPLLILHGEKDWRVKVSQAKKLSDLLKKEGKEHELVVFTDGDHGLNTHRPERNKRIFKWFEKYLF